MDGPLKGRNELEKPDCWISVEFIRPPHSSEVVGEHHHQVENLFILIKYCMPE